MATISKKVFLDSSVLLAFVDRAEAQHGRAVRVMESLAKLNFILYTSVQNVMDTYAALNREVGQLVAMEFLQACLTSSIEILFPQKGDLLTAQRLIKSNRERQVGIKEVVNATMMQKRDITHIITFTYWHNLFGTSISNIGG